MSKVERAIILAAGMGERMLPLTRTTPKPLIKVNGVRMIDSIIHALHVNGIFEIYVVVGHLKEQFYELPRLYPGLRLIENTEYASSNNISSLYAAREHLKNVMILDADQIILDSAVLRTDFERSGYNAVWTDGPTSEWLLTVNDGIVTHCSRTGGNSGWQLFSISRWTEEDGMKLRQCLECEFPQKESRRLYWDDLPLFLYRNDFRLGIFPMEKEAVTEIDSCRELIAIDSSYNDIIT